MIISKMLSVLSFDASDAVHSVCHTRTAGSAVSHKKMMKDTYIAFVWCLMLFSMQNGSTMTLKL
jgi:hypothetical protein